jgi:hypothetical protein
MNCLNAPGSSRGVNSVLCLRPFPIFDDADFAAFERRFGLGRRSYSKRETQKILGVGESQLDRLIREGALQPFVIGSQKHTFWATDIARLMFARRPPMSTTASSERKPRSPKQLTATRAPTQGHNSPPSQVSAPVWMAPRDGIEPPTSTVRACRSTN